MSTITVLLCACAVVMTSASAECGEGEKCAAEDNAALLQSKVLLHDASTEVAKVEASSPTEELQAVDCTSRSRSTCDPTFDGKMKGENPCMLKGNDCVAGCRTTRSRSTCEKNSDCRWRWAGYGMTNGWYCMGSYQEVYVGGDNKCHWYVNRKCTKRLVYGGRRVMRPEYMVKEHLKDDNSLWTKCGGSANCFKGYGRESMYVKLDGKASDSGSYLKAAVEVALKCTHKETIWVQTQDPAGMIPPVAICKDDTWTNSNPKVKKEDVCKDPKYMPDPGMIPPTQICQKPKYTCRNEPRVTGWTSNAKLELFYNNKDITETMTNKAHWGFKEYQLSASPDDKQPILRLEISREYAGATAYFQANVIVNRASVSVDGCMTNKANRKQCLENMEVDHSDTLLRSSHREQANCLRSSGGDGPCRAWKACLNAEAKEMIITVDEAFSMKKAAVGWLDLSGKTATQSSSGWSGSPSKAIDGNSNTQYGGGSCTHTHADANPQSWWQVDLGSSQKITKVKVTNRGDCCGTRLSGFSVLVDGHSCASSVAISQGQTKEVPCSAAGRRVRVQLNRRDYLTICEFAVWSSGQATVLLQQNRATNGQPQIEAGCQGSNEYNELTDSRNCKCGHHGTCLDPYSMDIESFDCACLNDIREMNKDDLHRHLCGRADVCCDWKITSGCTARTYWRGGVLALAQTVETDRITNNMSTRSRAEDVESAVSLDESLSGKRAGGC